MNFGIVMPKYVSKGEVYEFNFGLLFISACLKQHNINVFCLNPNHYSIKIDEQLSDFIVKNKIDVLCTGGMSVHCKEIIQIVETAKKTKSDIIVIVGGAIITSIPKVTLSNIRQIDYGVVGEGEETIVELADALINKTDIFSVKGLAYFDKKNNYILTEERIPIFNLDTIPFPDYDGFEYGEYIKLNYPSKIKPVLTLLDDVRIGYTLSSRSCPFKCTFCYHYPLSKYRQRSLDNIFKEIDYLVAKYNINFLSINDELFSTNKERMFKFAERIKPYNIKWYTSFRVSDVDKESLTVLKSAGMSMINYGIESLSNKILTSMNKHTTKEQIEKAMKLTYDAKINIQGNIILGDSEETEETVKESVDWLKSHPEYGINLIMIRMYPSSQLYKLSIKRGLITDEFKHMKNNFPLINLTKMNDKKYKDISIYVENFGSESQNLISGKVISSTVISKTECKENIFSVKVKCPHCSTINEYKNMVQIKNSFITYSFVVCRECYLNLRIENIKAYGKNYTPYDKFISFVVRKARNQVNKNQIVYFTYCALKKLKNNNIIPISNKYI